VSTENVQWETKLKFTYNYALSVMNDGIATAEQKLKDIIALLTGTANLATAETRATVEAQKATAHVKDEL
jgi:hypothetical protein